MSSQNQGNQGRVDWIERVPGWRWLRRLDRRLSLLEERHESAGRAIQRQAKDLGALEHELGRLTGRFESLELQLKTPLQAQRGLLQVVDGKRRLGFASTPTSPSAYLHFENRFRGHVQDIQARMRAYLPLLPQDVLDLGHGRAEMMELLAKDGRTVAGVDLDKDMVDLARGKGLDSSQADAIAFLSSEPADAWSGIFSAQMVEHLEYQSLMKLLAEARRVLKPNGTLVLETVNPHSLVAFRAFWVDPTHRMPLYPEVLLTLVQAAGYASAYVWFPQGTGDFDADIWNQGDYAIIATKGEALE